MQQQRNQRRPQLFSSEATMLLMTLIPVLMLIDCSYGWSTASSSSITRTNGGSTTASSRRIITIRKSSPSSFLTSSYYRNPTILADEIPFYASTIQTNNDDSPTATPAPFLMKKDIFPETTNNDNNNVEESTTSSSTPIDCTIPWVDNEKDEEENKDVHYLKHWNMQVSYFQKHLTNFRIATENDHEEYNDLMYINNEKKRQKVYTVSYTSDEYRDIRMTYMSFPGSQFFRCLCYPHDEQIPILGMGMMKFGGRKNMAVLDYQPLPTSSDDIRDRFESELKRIRTEYPTMTQPMSNKHFDSYEERKYFTEIPLITKWDDGQDRKNDVDNDVKEEEYRTELIDAQREYVKSYIRLTKEQQRRKQNNKGESSNDILRVHSDFDTFVSDREPAGKVLMGALGKDTGHALTHRVIFPLSRNF